MIMRQRGLALTCAIAWWMHAPTVPLLAHAGPPFPIVSDRIAGPYRISVWTDPDATDDGTPAGQFWVYVDAVAKEPLPPNTIVTVSIVARNRDGQVRSAVASPEQGDTTRRFATLLMDHEGLYGVRTSVAGPLGSASVDADVEATYDLRPPPLTVALYLVPFVLVGGLWLKLLLRRRGRPPTQAPR
jgi:hypothetical protein